MEKQKIVTGLKNAITAKVAKTVLNPFNEIVDQNIMDITTTIGSFIVRSVRGKFQRSITFTIGSLYSDRWMEEALYGILYEYNNIKKCTRLELANKAGVNDGTGMYYRLDDGTHNLKYRNYDILLFIQSIAPQSISGGGRLPRQRVYTIITYNLSPEFVRSFELDMLRHRNSLLQIKSDAPTINIFKDSHESDGYTYWEKNNVVTKRRLGTIYLPYEQKKLLVDTINNFFSSKEYYQKHGIAHNLKILLYGPPGPQPLNTPIPTMGNDGKTRSTLGSIKPGDKVFAITGEISVVTEVINYDDLNLYTVHLSDGRSTRCAGTHKFPVMIDNTYQKLSVEEMYKIFEERVREEVDGDSFKGIELQQAMPCMYEHYGTEINPWLIGFIAANAYFKPILSDKRKIMVLKIGRNNYKCIDMITSITGWIPAKLHPFDKDEYMFINPNNGKLVSNGKFKNAIDIYPCDDGSTSRVSWINPHYMINNERMRWTLIKGLCDGLYAIDNDLTTEPHITIKKCDDMSYTISPKFDEWLKAVFIEIVRGLAVIVDTRDNGVCVRCNGYIAKKFFEITSNILNEIEMDIISEEYTQNYNIPLYITGIEDNMISVPMRCIHIDHPSHVYLTNDYIPTCNSGKDSIVKMIASEWNRNIYYVGGGKGGKFIPNALVDQDDDVTYPLFVISDIDKYPFLINEPNMDISKDEDAKEDKVGYKQLFGAMINALDGVVSGEDRIIIMTTNHIEKFSDTFRRPGRIDLEMEIGYVTPEVFRKYVYDFYSIELPKDIQLVSDKLRIPDFQADVVFMKLTADQFINKYVVQKKK